MRWLCAPWHTLPGNRAACSGWNHASARSPFSLYICVVVGGEAWIIHVCHALFMQDGCILPLPSPPTTPQSASVAPPARPQASCASCQAPLWAWPARCLVAPPRCRRSPWGGGTVQGKEAIAWVKLVVPIPCRSETNNSLCVHAPAHRRPGGRVLDLHLQGVAFPGRCTNGWMTGVELLEQVRNSARLFVPSPCGAASHRLAYQ